MAQCRMVPGHWEEDLLFGNLNSQIATRVERHTGYAMLVKIAGKDTETVISALIKVNSSGGFGSKAAIQAAQKQPAMWMCRRTPALGQAAVENSVESSHWSGLGVCYRPSLRSADSPTRYGCGVRTPLTSNVGGHNLHASRNHSEA